MRAAYYGVAVIRLVLIAWQRSQFCHSTPKQLETIYAIITTVIGLFWALCCLKAYSEDPVSNFVVMTFVMGISALAIPTLNTFIYILILYTFASLLVSCYMILSDDAGSNYVALGVFV